MTGDVVAETRNGVIIRIRVTPGSSRLLLTVAAGHIAIAVRAPAEKGKATEEALRALADWLGIPRSRLALTGGATSRDKRVAVRGESASDLRKRIREQSG